MTTARKLISSLAVAAVASLAVTMANAAEQTMGVKAADLDLSRPADVQALYERVQGTANELCRAEAHRHYQSTRMAAPLGWRARCVSETVEAAVRQIANPRLAALHGQGSSQPL